MAAVACIHIAGDVMVCLQNVQFICFLLHSLIPHDAHVYQSAQPLCGLIWNSMVLFFSRIRTTTKTVNKTQQGAMNISWTISLKAKALSYDPPLMNTHLRILFSYGWYSLQVLLPLYFLLFLC